MSLFCLVSCAAYLCCGDYTLAAGLFSHQLFFMKTELHNYRSFILRMMQHTAPQRGALSCEETHHGSKCFI